MSANFARLWNPILLAATAAWLAAGSVARAEPPASLESGWADPPRGARLVAYWWWLNGNVTEQLITHDLEEMKAKGFGGACIIDAGGADQEGNARVPHGPTFFTPKWRELYKHALREGSRLGLDMSLTIQSGWNLGGPIVTAEDAGKKLVWTEAKISGPQHSTQALPAPKTPDPYYHDLFVLAYPIRTNQAPHKPIENWREKALDKTLGSFSAPVSTPLFEEFPATPGEEDAHAQDVVDLTDKLDAGGKLDWDAPAGDWQVIRIGCTVGDHAHVSTCSEGWKGYALDVFDAGAFQRYWNAIVEPLIADAGRLAGTTLKYFHTDSWEVEALNWTPTLRAEFRKRRGYDMLPFLPALTGRIINTRMETDRFLADYRKTLGDLAIDNHYRLYRDNSHAHGIEIHPESGGPHGVPIDAQRCLGWDDVPMSEFWAWSWEHRIGDDNRYFMKQPASAAHTYGRKIAQGEGFTCMGPHWQESLWSNLKPSFDKALCEGLNRLVWHAFVCSPASAGLPGQQYFAGTHLNPEVTWWDKSAPFMAYINRSEYLLQQGLFCADICYYYGDHVPNFAQLKASDPAKILPGYDYDVITEEAILTRMSVRDGRLVLPDGMSYRMLVLPPDRTIISLPVLRKLKELIADGATIIGPKPTQASGLENFPRSDAELAALAEELWNRQTPYGKGRVIWDRSARQVLADDGVKPDFEHAGDSEEASIDYIHRTTADAEIYFISSRSNRMEHLQCTFRVAGKAPEIWDAVSGEHHFAAAYTEKDGRITVPLDFNPCGSCFVIFRQSAGEHPPAAQGNELKVAPCGEISGEWTVDFDPKWGGPKSARFDKLTSWTARPEAGIKYYSGTAVYHKSFDLPAGKAGSRMFLDLGKVRELAEVRLNGKNLGIVWSPPFRVEITDAVKQTGNDLEVEVVNFWPNRIIGDHFLPKEKRFTQTNIRKLTKDTPLMESGLFGPVQIMEQQ